MSAREELVSAIAQRCARRDRAEHGRIPDEFATMTGFHCKAYDAVAACSMLDGASGASDRGFTMMCCARGTDRRVKRRQTGSAAIACDS
jgi:hypothetical protein